MSPFSSKDRGTIPVNTYVINLAKSGTGKGASTNFIEEHLTQKFRTRFMDQTFPELANDSLKIKAQNDLLKLPVSSEITEQDLLINLQKEFEDLGDLPFDYDTKPFSMV